MARLESRLKSAAYEKIKICSRVEVDDDLYIVDSDAKAVGPFDTQFYSIYLKREKLMAKKAFMSISPFRVNVNPKAVLENLDCW